MRSLYSSQDQESQNPNDDSARPSRITSRSCMRRNTVNANTAPIVYQYFNRSVLCRWQSLTIFYSQGSQQQEVKFQDLIFRKFQDIFVGFTRLKTQKKLIFMCSKMLFIEADQYCSPKNVTKAMLHIKL